ncbi:unnamed protein product [Ectocarpus sp. CCAP 1310/34]|nr:unnamed protein product [Ectocarpus sp. CCAP 1310/34]
MYAQILEGLGGVDVYPLQYPDFAENGNMLEPEEISKRHFLCGDPVSGSDEEDILCTTPNAEWEVLSTFISGQVIEMDIVMNFYHWFQFSICDAADLNDPDGVGTQECLNTHPLTRAPDDGDGSPIDPNYTGRYYPDPPCRLNETDQAFYKDGLPSGTGYDPYGIKMRFLFPDIECSHCILQVYYFTGHTCKHVDYDEFNPPSWRSNCAPHKSDWVFTDLPRCGTGKYLYAEEFWSCSGDTQTEGNDDDIPSSSIDHGCFADTKTGRVMKWMSLRDEKKHAMKGEMCMDICIQGGYKYSGTQHGYQCFCRGKYTDHLEHGESADCDHPCAGNENEICGGPWCMSVREMF